MARVLYCVSQAQLVQRTVDGADATDLSVLTPYRACCQHCVAPLLRDALCRRCSTSLYLRWCRGSESREVARGRGAVAAPVSLQVLRRAVHH
jgi:hypothetical protein